jgi:hypothetical protein
MPDTFTAPVLELDKLVDIVGEKLQLSATAYTLAEERYKSVGNWLCNEQSLLKKYNPKIYPQGSLNIGTTLKLIGRKEFDLDFVCELQINPALFSNPVILLDMLQSCLESSGKYKSMLERKNRCIRLFYADEFYMDILPAVPNPTFGKYGDTCLLVPDCEAKSWKHSNPKGFAAWFKEMAFEAFKKSKRSLSPLPEQQAYEEMAVLQRAVQLMKRRRDIALESVSLKDQPISIVITTLAAHGYLGTSSVSQAIRQILDYIVSLIESSAGRIVVKNPTNELEDLSERWDSNKKAYEVFVNWIYEFRRDWDALCSAQGFHLVKNEVERMFGERVTKDAVDEYMKRFNEQRSSGNLAISKGSGLIVPVGSVNSAPVPKNTFHGE